MKPTLTDNQLTATAYGVSAVLLWSTVATGFKLGLAELQIEQLLFLGTCISWFFFGVLLLIRGQFSIERRDRVLAPLLGIINPVGYYLILFSAYDLLPAHIAQPLNYTWAITLAILSVTILKEPLALRAIIGIAVSYVGVVFLILSSSLNSSQGADGAGVMLALSSTILWALYWLINKKSQSDPLSMIFTSFSTAVPILFMICLCGPGLPELSQSAVFYGLWIGLIEMGVTYLLWQKALRSSSNTAKTGQLIFLSPFLSLVFIHFFLDEQITLLVIASLVIIVLGTWITQRADPEKL